MIKNVLLPQSASKLQSRSSVGQNNTSVPVPARPAVDTVFFAGRKPVDEAVKLKKVFFELIDACQALKEDRFYDVKKFIKKVSKMEKFVACKDDYNMYTDFCKRNNLDMNDCEVQRNVLRSALVQVHYTLKNTLKDQLPMQVIQGLEHTL